MPRKFRWSAVVLVAVPLLANAGPLVVDEGDFYVVPINDQQVTGDVIVHGTFLNQGEVTHGGLFENFGLTDNQGQLTNLGEFRNYGLLTNSGTFDGPGLLVNNGTVINGFRMNVSADTYVASGTWLNDSFLTFKASDVLITGLVQNDGARLTFAGSVEVAADAALAQRDLVTEIGNSLVNRGVTEVAFGSLQAERVENHGTVNIDSQLVANAQYQQYSGETVLGQLLSPSVQVFGGTLSGNGSFSDISAVGDETLVEMFGGTITGGDGRLNIAGGLILYEDAVMAITIGDENTASSTGDIAAYDLVLDGTLQVQFEPGAVISPGDSWVLASAGTISGGFDTIILPSVAGIDFELDIDGFGFDRLLLSAAAIPVPAPLLLLLSASVVLLRLRRHPRPYHR